MDKNQAGDYVGIGGDESTGETSMFGTWPGMTIAAWLAAIMLAAGPSIVSPCCCADTAQNPKVPQARAKLKTCCCQQAKSCCSRQVKQTCKCPCCARQGATGSGEPCGVSCSCGHQDQQPATTPPGGSGADDNPSQKMQVSSLAPAVEEAPQIVGADRPAFLPASAGSAAECCALLCRRLI
jgi:hypothetical protein